MICLLSVEKSKLTLFLIVKSTNVSDDIELEALSARMAETERMLHKILGHLERRDEVYLLGSDELARDITIRILYEYIQICL